MVIQLKQMGMLSGNVPLTSFTLSETELRMYSLNGYFIGLPCTIEKMKELKGYSADKRSYANYISTLDAIKSKLKTNTTQITLPLGAILRSYRETFNMYELSEVKETRVKYPKVKSIKAVYIAIPNRKEKSMYYQHISKEQLAKLTLAENNMVELVCDSGSNKITISFKEEADFTRFKRMIEEGMSAQKTSTYFVPLLLEELSKKLAISYKVSGHVLQQINFSKQPYHVM